MPSALPQPVFDVKAFEVGGPGFVDPHVGGVGCGNALPNHSWALSWMMMKSNFGLMPTPVQSRPR